MFKLITLITDVAKFIALIKSKLLSLENETFPHKTISEVLLLHSDIIVALSN